MFLLWILSFGPELLAAVPGIIEEPSVKSVPHASAIIVVIHKGGREPESILHGVGATTDVSEDIS